MKACWPVHDIVGMNKEVVAHRQAFKRVRARVSGCEQAQRTEPCFDWAVK